MGGSAGAMGTEANCDKMAGTYLSILKYWVIYKQFHIDLVRLIIQR